MEGGPDGCLQYFTGTSGTVSNYNYPTTSSTVTSTSNFSYVKQAFQSINNLCLNSDPLVQSIVHDVLASRTRLLRPLLLAGDQPGDSTG